MPDFAVSNIAWLNEEEPLAFNILKKNSIDFLEVAPARVVSNVENFSISEVKDYKNHCLKSGFSVVSMQALLFGGPNRNIFGDNEDRKLLQEHLLKIITMARELGASKLVFGSPKNRIKGQLSRESAFEMAADFFDPLAREAASFGIEIVIENNPSYYGADFLTTTNEVCEFIRFANIKGLGAHFDTGGMFLSNENYNKSLQSNAKLISHLHVSEKNLLPLSISDIDHKAIGFTLKKICYNKIISLEMKRGDNNIYDLSQSVELLNEFYR